MKQSAVPRALRERLGDDGTAAFVEVFTRHEDQVTHDVVRAIMREMEPRFASIEATLGLCVRKTDVAGFAAQASVDGVGQKLDRLAQKFDRLAETHDSFALALERGLGGIRADMAGQRADLLKWMFVFWVGQAFVVLAYLRAAE